MSGESGVSERPRLQLKPRDPNAAQAYEANRARAGSNPFGAAKPREQIIAERLGKTEEEVLKEAVKKERPKLRLSPEQLEQRKQAEARIEEIKAQLEAADNTDQSALETELVTREAELDALLDKFEAIALEAAQRGEIQRPSERRQQQQVHGDADAGRPVGRGGYGGSYNERHGYHERHGRGYYDKEGGGGRGGYGGEPREYDRPRGGYDKEGGSFGRGGYGPRGGRGGHDRAEGGYDRYDRSHDRDGGRGGGDREGGRGGAGVYDRNEGDFDNGPRGARGGDWGGDRGGSSRPVGAGGYDRRGGGSVTYERRGGSGYDEGSRGGYGTGVDDGLRGGRSGGPRGGYNNRGRNYDPAYEDLTSTDYVSPYQNNQDRY